MTPKFLIPFLTIVFLAAPLGLSGSVQAKVNKTSSRSNTQHNITAAKPSTLNGQGQPADRMGGGGGARGGAARMGGGQTK
jgi:hypothetical protein